MVGNKVFCNIATLKYISGDTKQSAESKRAAKTYKSSYALVKCS